MNKLEGVFWFTKKSVSSTLNTIFGKLSNGFPRERYKIWLKKTLVDEEDAKDEESDNEVGEDVGMNYAENDHD